MRSLKGVKAGAGILLLSGALLGGCVVAPAPGPYVTVAPPAPQYEVVGVAPSVGFVWLPGYWNWAGGRYTWVGGHWDRGRPGYHWVAHSWVRGGGGWRMAPGHWAR
jgi:YXWGXW repeat-containing protein